MPFETALIIFLKRFPELSSKFYAGNEFWIKPEEEYLQFLEVLILKRLESINREGDWRKEYKQKQIELFEKAQTIVEFEFLGKQYKTNTFGDRDKSTTLNLITMYDVLIESKNKGSLGLKVVPHTNQ